MKLLIGPSMASNNIKSIGKSTDVKVSPLLFAKGTDISNTFTAKYWYQYIFY